MTKYVVGEGEEWRGFYEKHFGGSGNVIMVMVAPNGETYPERFALFSSIDKAQEWADTLPGKPSVCFAPFVVDEPDFGNKLHG